MSGKRYRNVSESSSDEEYHESYKNSDESNEKSDDYENDSKIMKKADTSSSSFDMNIKRGRGRSKRPCMNKNAQAARENRIRKKKHLEQVENKLSFYQQKNKSLVNVIQKQDIDIKKLKGEVTYLRCILKNNTNITALLKSMNEGLLNKKTNDKMKKNKFYNVDNKSSTENITVMKNMNQRVSQTIPKSQTSPQSNNSEFDHTYTIPKITGEIEETNEDIENCENNSVFNEKISFSSRFDKNPSPISSFPLSHSEEIINGNITDTEMEEWARFNANMYDNFTNFHGSSLSPSDNMENLTNLYDDGNILEEFRDAGICLHVNSDKVSLEFCSICHMNSLNSMPE